MQVSLTFRSLIVRALLAFLFAGCSGGVLAQHRGEFSGRESPMLMRITPILGRGQRQRPAPIERREPPTMQAGRGTHLVGPDGRRGGEHLAQWMNQHGDMTVQQQQQALDREPGFRELPGAVQQRMHNRLAQLNAMPPMERQRVLADTEAMERLTLVQRSQVRGAMEQLGSLPPGQRREVARSFRELRLLPPYERMAAMNSERYRWMNYAERTTLTNLLLVAPMLPPR